MEVKTHSEVMSGYETALMELWGTADYSIFNVTALIDANTVQVEHVTSLTSDETVSAGNKIVLVMSDGENVYTEATIVIGDHISLSENIPDEGTIEYIVVYRLLPSGTIGGKEIALESAQESLRKIQERVGDNLVRESDVYINSSQYLVKRYTLTEDWEVGARYTLSIWGDANEGNELRAWRDNGSVALPPLTYNAQRKCFEVMFDAPDTTRPEKNVISVYNYPQETATSASIVRIKLEFGEMGTPWSAASDTSNAELIAEYEQKIAALKYGNESGQGVYELTREAAGTAILLEAERNAYQQAVDLVNTTESTFANQMGDLLRDGYWQDNSYIVGQEQNLYNDAVEVLSVMSKPVAEYQVNMINTVGMDAAPHMNVSINSAAHIIDDEIAVNAWGYVNNVVYCLDQPHKNQIKISTQESRFAGQSFTQIVSKIAETAKDIRGKQGVFGRAGLITKDGKMPAAALDGVINVEMTRLLSRTSGWRTDENGNIVLESLDGTCAMMLTGEGFMIADNKTYEGKWDWRTFGTGRGFTADEITAGTLRANIVRILGTDQFYWDSDNIYIIDPVNPNRQIRIGRYDGENYGIGFTKDDGGSWESTIGFDGIDLNYTTIDVSNITGIEDLYLPRTEAMQIYETTTNVGAINSTLQDLSNDIRQNIQFTAGGIIIQQRGSTGGFSSRFTSTALEFYQGVDRIAWFENRALNVSNVEAQKQMSIGKLVWHVNQDGSISAKWRDS
jgi:hypothetical protein